MAEIKPTRDMPQDADFVRRVFCYLEDQISPDDLKILQRELQKDPPKQDAFIELCMTRRGVIEVIRSRSESTHQRQKTAEHELSETMVVPAITAADFEPEEPILPGPSSYVPGSQQSSGRSIWQQNWFRAAAILLPLLTGFLIWHSLGGGGPSASNTGVDRVAQNSGTDSDRGNPVASNPHPSSEPVAVIAPPAVAPTLASVTYSLHAAWDHTGTELQTGAKLSDGPHTLDTGLAEITLAGGAAVVLQAPVSFEVTSQSQIRLTSGQVSATVPHGTKGLSIQSPDVLVTDLGTEFGMEVRSHEQTHVEVFTGKVQVDLPAAQGGANTFRIISSQESAVVKTGSTSIDADIAQPLSFVRSDELKARVSTGGDQAMPRWKAFSETLRKDPQLAAYYTFENQATAPNQLTNESLVTKGNHDGALGYPALGYAAPRWAQGRWPGKASLEFGENTNSLLTLPNDDGELTATQSLSYVFWVSRSETQRPVHFVTQAAGNKRAFNIAFTGTAGKQRPLLPPNSILFDYGAANSARSTAVLPGDRQWCMLAVTVAPDSSVRFYVDGQFAEQGTVKIPDVDRTGAVWIGRPSPAIAQTTALEDVFVGRLDELAVFRRVLSDQEIHRIYDAGKPE